MVQIIYNSKISVNTHYISILIFITAPIITRLTMPTIQPNQNTNDQSENIPLNNHIVLKSRAYSFANNSKVYSENQSLYHRLLRRQTLCQVPYKPDFVIKSNQVINPRDSLSRSDFNTSSAYIEEKQEQEQPESWFEQQSNKDQQMVPQYAEKCLNFMIVRQKSRLISIEAILQKNIIYKQKRSDLLDWLVRIHHEMNLSTETFFNAVYYLDRYLSKQSVEETSLELISLSALNLAAKYEQTYAKLSITYFISAARLKNTKQELSQTQQRMLQSLEFDLIYDSPNKYFEIFSKLTSMSHKNSCIGYYLLELAALDIKYLAFSSSQLAAAIFTIVLKIKRVSPAWPKQLEELTGYCQEQLSDCVRFVGNLIQNQTNIGSYVKNKYGKQEFCCASATKFYRRIV